MVEQDIGGPRGETFMILKKILSFLLFLSFPFIYIFLGVKALFWCFGGLFVISGFFALGKRIRFGFAEKEEISGEIVEVREDYMSEGGRTYTPIIGYTYKDQEYVHKNAISSFTFQRSYSVGDRISLLVRVDKPKEFKVNKPVYLLLDYILSILFIAIGCVLFYFASK